MEFIIAIIIIFFIVKKLLKSISEKENLNFTPLPYELLHYEELRLPYYKKKYLLSIAERNFYNTLIQALPQKYIIFPQMQLSRILKVSAHGHTYYSYLDKIDRKSVDFVICTKNYLEPVLAIELDDSTHNLEQRIERDNFVNEVFNSTDLNLLRIKCRESYSLIELSKQLKVYLKH